ncbi:MAG: VapE family protein [Bacillota bacterium]|nr:VapE family protein [Bacillota bacterium]
MAIYTAQSRRDQQLKPENLTVPELFSRLSASVPLAQTWDEYRALPKGQQDDLKDVGGFVAGVLADGRRRSGCVVSRCAAVLDLDNLPSGTTEEVIHRVEALGCAFCVYSTAKHHPSKPRLRVVVPFAQDVAVEEYRPLVRLLAQRIEPEMGLFDPTCDEAARLMYWPVRCSDVEPVFVADASKPLLDPAALLAALTDWRDATSWPSWPGSDAIPRLAAKQGDPTAKTGLVGAFCRVYDVETAMDVFLPGIYTAAGEGRYTFTGGSSFGGAVIYDGGKFLFSHHATDPCGSRLVNAWDLVRLHRFGALDDDAAPGTPGGRLPSYLAMQQLARQDDAVRRELATESFQAAQDIAVVDAEAAVQLHTFAGQPLSLAVVRAALRAYGITARTNEVTGRLEVHGLPSEYSAANAPNILPVWLMDKLRGVGVKQVSKNAVTDYLTVIVDADRVNPVRQMLTGTVWDGHERLPELLDILGVDPGSLSAVLVRKWLLQTVALAFNDGDTAADGVLTLQGAQGLGKTFLFRRLAMEPSWFVEGASLEGGKDDFINATGGWLVELGELERSLRRDPGKLKAFITSPADNIRKPYAREASWAPRHTSLCATVNQGEFLADETGDRRFWVVPVTRLDLDRLKALPVEWFRQLWSEVYALYVQDVGGFRLTPEERAALAVSNRSFRVPAPGEDDIQSRFNFSLPETSWGEFLAAELRLQFRDQLQGFTSRRIGRTLAKMVDEDDRLSSRTLKGRTYYRLPIPKNVTMFDSVESIPPQGLRNAPRSTP